MTKHNPNKLRIFDTMAQASKILSLPIQVLRWAKAQGCESFLPGSRVRSDVSEWLIKHPYPDSTAELPAKEVLERERMLKQNRDLDAKHEIKMGKYVLIDTAKTGWAKGMEIVQKVMLTYMDKSIYNKAIREMKLELEALDL